ncbi:MAG: hypothetical protein ACSLFQ_15815 [Thermoanaerobaculia bacterium]
MKGRLVARTALTPAEVDAMFRLLEAHFVGVSRAQFERDLGEKNWALLLEDEEGTLAGFSTILFYDSIHDGEPVSVVYSGDTIVAPSHWNSPGLSRSWIHAVRELHARASTSKLWWLLLTAGFRTYRFLPLFWKEFSPRHDAEPSGALSSWMAELARERFGDRYDASDGIVRFEKPYRLRPELAETPRGRLDDPHVAYFLSRNPGFVNGDELVCLTEITSGNLTRAGWRMVDPSVVRSRSLA